jgi:prephenate dehydrogenase
MTVQLTIIGLGQIGASIGLALEKHGDKLKRIGSDIDPKVMKQALKLGAVDKTALNLNVAVRDADVLILALPLDQVQAVMRVVAPELKEGAVLMDTAPIKVATAEWAGAILPKNCSYVGFTPILNPRYLHNEGYGIAAARPDLFQNGMFGITTPPKTSSQAVNLATSLAQLMDADPLFVDLHEIDGLMAATHLLPQLMSAALLNATLDQPGWQEARKVTGRAFAEVSGPAAHLDDIEALVAAANLNRENTVRKLDDAIAALQGLRREIAQDDSEALSARLKHAKAGVDQWWKERGGGNWLAEELPKTDNIPTSSDVMGSIFGFGLRRKKKDRG